MVVRLLLFVFIVVAALVRGESPSIEVRVPTPCTLPVTTAHPDLTPLWYDIFIRPSDSRLVITGPDLADTMITLTASSCDADALSEQREPLPVTFAVNGRRACVRFLSSSDIYRPDRHVYVAELVSADGGTQWLGTLLSENDPIAVDVTFVGRATRRFTVRRNTPHALTHGLHTRAVQIFGNNATLLPQWLSHHAGLGFETFLVYYNGNDTGRVVDAFRQTTTPRLVRVVVWQWLFPYYDRRGQISGQVSAQTHAIHRHSMPEVEWMLMTDDDEYLVPRAPLNTLDDVIAAGGGGAGIAIETVWFGCRPDDVFGPDNFTRVLVRRARRSCGPYERQKALVHVPDVVVHTIHVIFEFAAGHRGVFAMPPEKAWIHHYAPVGVKHRSCVADEVVVEDTRMLELQTPTTPQWGW